MFIETVLVVLFNIIFLDIVLLPELWVMFPSEFVGDTVEGKTLIEVKFATNVLND